MPNRATFSHIATTVLLTALAIGSVAQAQRVRPVSAPVRFDAMTLARAGAWSRVPDSPTRSKVNVDALTSARYRRADGALLQLTIASRGDARRQFEMHYPDLCHELRGDVVDAQSPRLVSLPHGGPWPVQVFSWRPAAPTTGALCLYGMVLGGRAVPHTLSAKWTQLSASLFGTTLAGHLLRVDVFAPRDLESRMSAGTNFLSSLDGALDESMRAALFGTSPPTETTKENLR